MRIESVRSLKAELVSQNVNLDVFSQKALPRSMRRAARAMASAVPESSPKLPSVALGVAGKGKQDCRLAVRIFDTVSPGLNEMVSKIQKRAAGEVDLRFVGKVHKQQSSWTQKTSRPLQIGSSVGHFAITAGTLGCFAKFKGKEGGEMILSNNHVLANENQARLGDVIIQAGPADGGQSPTDAVANLSKFVRIKSTGNLVDAAVAELEDEVEYFYNWLQPIGPISGVRSEPAELGELVQKVGRTTDFTLGRVNAIELDDVVVGYDFGDASFDGQVEIIPDGPPPTQPFSMGGDSGSLIVDRDRHAVALLFAGNGFDTTYANPIDSVLSSLGIELVF